MPSAGSARLSTGISTASRRAAGVSVDPEANSIAWLVWHLTRIQDDHLADAFEAEQVWTSQGWVERFGLPFDPRDTGYGHQAHDVAAAQVGSGELLVGYHDAVHQQTTRYVQGLSDADLARIVDRSWDPPGVAGGAADQRARRRPAARRAGGLRPRRPAAQ